LETNICFQIFFSVHMLSRGQVYHVVLGSPIVLDCEFHMDEFRMFDNPILWEKEQEGERTRINMVGVVHEPFAATRRFELSFTSQYPRYNMQLQIKGLPSSFLID